MTRLPIDSWAVTPLDLPAYDLNTVCPVTGKTSGLEDHHIWRRSFTALGKENQEIYWVAVQDGSKRIFKNRIALSPETHQRITTNIARLEYRDDELWYIEGDSELLLDVHLRLTTPAEKITKKRKPIARTAEERKANTRYLIHVPGGEENVIPELVEAAREHLAPQFGWNDDVPAYFVVTAALASALQG